MYKQLYQECEAANNTSNTKFILPKAEVYDYSPRIYPLKDSTIIGDFPLYSADNVLKNCIVKVGGITITTLLP